MTPNSVADKSSSRPAEKKKKKKGLLWFSFSTRAALKRAVSVFFAFLSHLHDVPDDAGTFTAGRHTLFVIRPDFDASHRGFVPFEGLQQPVAVRLQLPNTHLQRTSPNTVARHNVWLQTRWRTRANRIQPISYKRLKIKNQREKQHHAIWLIHCQTFFERPEILPVFVCFFWCIIHWSLDTCRILSFRSKKNNNDSLFDSLLICSTTWTGCIFNPLFGPWLQILLSD